MQEIIVPCKVIQQSKRNGPKLSKLGLKKQARKPRSYASPKLRPSELLTDRGEV